MGAKIICYLGLAGMIFSFPQETPIPVHSLSPTQLVVQPKAYALVRRAVREIKNNCNPGPHRLNGYYRQYSRDSTRYFNYLEATVSKYDFGYAVGNHKSRYILHQARFHPAYLLLPKLRPVDGTFDWSGYNELAKLMFQDPLRNYKQGYFRSVNLRYLEFFPVHVFTIEREYENSYTVKIGSSDYLMDLKYEVKGMIKISKDGYAIEEFRYCFKDPHRSWSTNSELVVKYSKHHNFWYPEYYGFKKQASDQDTANEYFQEFFVEDVSLDNVKLITQQEMIDLKKPLTNAPFSEVPNYWEDYSLNQNTDFSWAPCPL